MARMICLRTTLLAVFFVDRHNTPTEKKFRTETKMTRRGERPRKKEWRFIIPSLRTYHHPYLALLPLRETA